MNNQLQQNAEQGIKALLLNIGEDITRDGLLDTPKRVVKAYAEMTVGYAQDPADILATTFAVGNVDEMVILRNIDFVSLCEHHLLPFTGTATLAYLPEHNGRVVGLSKLARLVDCLSRRLQVQERLTTQLTEALDMFLVTLGSACLIRATHSCMTCRGVRKNGEMITSSLTGVFRDSAVRAEFLALA
jgi:GTP cyclohydrolase I